MKPKKHDHRGSLWIIAGGAILWCYQCGAWTFNGQYRTSKRMQWSKPTGLGGPNPAMSKPKRGRPEQER